MRYMICCKDEKNELRRQVRAEIEALPGEYITESDNGLFRAVTSLEEFIAAGSVMIYYSIDREPRTIDIAETALKLGKTVAFPYCYNGGRMEARVVKSLDELEPAMLKIPAPVKASTVIAPEDIDFIIVPALTYDRDGFRLGYGGGYYDRYLQSIGAFKAGIGRELLIKPHLPREAHDVAVDCLVTESRITRFSSPNSA